VLMAAHRDLESITLDRDTQHFKDNLANEYASLIYNGLWFTRKREALDALINKTQELVNGTVRIKLYKGNCMIVGRKSDDSLYSADIATFDASTLYDQKDATGFLNLYGLPIKVEAMMRNRKK